MINFPLSLYPWQQPLWQQVTEAYRTQRLPHAFMLTGASGFGQPTFAKQITQLLLCRNPTSQQQSCGKCKSCILMAAESHPDFYYVGLEGTKKSIGIEQVRDIIAEVGQTSNQGTYQVVMVEPAEKLTAAAANAFLKTLEEPPGAVMFILICYHTATLPITIRSRCQVLHFRSDTESSLNWLLQQKEISLEDAKRALLLNNNQPLTTLTVIESGNLKTAMQIWQDLQNLLQGKQDIVSTSKNWAKVDLVEYLRLFQVLLREILKAYYGVKLSHLAYAEALSSNINVFTHFHGLHTLNQLKAVIQLQEQVEKGVGVNIELQLQSLLIGWLKCFKSKL